MNVFVNQLRSTDSALYNTWGGIDYSLKNGDLITGDVFAAKCVSFNK